MSEPYKIVLALLWTVLPARAQTAQDTCLAHALQNYEQLRTAALLESSPVAFPETVVGIRRMEEAYCYRVAYCKIGNPAANPPLRIPYAVEFSTCIRDEDLEENKDDVK
jgi:hypothetical protein